MRSVVDYIRAGSGRTCLLAGAFFVASAVVSFAQVSRPPAASAGAAEKVEAYLDSISGRGAARRTPQTIANLRDSVLESGGVVRYLMAKSEMSAGEIQYVYKFALNGPDAAVPLLKDIDSAKVTKFVETIEVKAWISAERAYKNPISADQNPIPADQNPIPYVPKRRKK